MPYSFLQANSVKNKTVLLRVDFNESVDEKGKLLDNFRIASEITTIKMLREQGAKVVILSHAGRPEGKRDAQFSLKPMAQCLSEFLGFKFVETKDQVVSYPIEHVVFVNGDITLQAVQQAVKEMAPKDIVVLENLRFYPGEDGNDSAFAQILASLGDVFVNDAFAVAHRKTSSTVGVTKLLPSFVGPLLAQEIKNLDYIMHKAKSPFVLVMGGIKISDKAKILKALGQKADHILLGGGLANIFFSAQGLEIGQSVIEPESKQLAWEMLQNYKEKIILPKDVVVVDLQSSKQQYSVKSAYNIKPSEKIGDIGPKAILEYSQILKTAETICWNGPLGYFEKPAFKTGTMALARVIGGVSKGRAFGVAGGGETVAAIRQAHQFENMDHVSTGGGAMLEFLSGAELPGISALQKN